MTGNAVKKILYIFLFVFLPLGAYAQRSEVGLTGGTAFYLGDLNPKTPFSQALYSAGLFYRFNIDTRWAFKLGFTYGRVQADDQVHGNDRNLNFRSDIFDFSAMMEVNFLTFFIGSKKHRWTPYLTLGLAGFHMNPMGSYTDPLTKEKKWVALQPLGTEGQQFMNAETKPYSSIQAALPFGLGFRVSLGQRIAIGVEWTMRLAFTDYLDDVSGNYVDNIQILMENGELAAYMADPSATKHEVGAMRGTGSSKFDWYSFLGVTLSVKLGSERESCPAYSPNAMSRYQKMGRW